jgi:predicted GTPase
VVANKMDEEAATANLKSFKRRVRKTLVLPISAAFDEGIPAFRKVIREMVEESGGSNEAPGSESELESQSESESED